MFAVVNKDIDNDRKKIIKEKAIQILKTKFGSAPKVDLNIVSQDSIIGEESKFRMQFITKLLSAPVYGKDFSEELPNFKADKDTARNLVTNLSKKLSKAKDELLNANNEATLKKICRWVMKKIIRSGFLQVMAEHGVYTNSLETSTALFSNKFPEKAEPMKKAYALSREPTSDKNQILEVVNQLVDWIDDKNKNI